MVNLGTIMILATQGSSKQSEGGEFCLGEFKHHHPANMSLIICWLSTFREIPLELREQSRGGQVNLDMEDHRDEDFVKPKVSFKAFGGEGQKLGRWEQEFSNFPRQYLSCCINVIFFG